MERLRLSRATHQLLERGVEALEKIGRELGQHNDRQENEQTETDNNRE